MNINDKVWVRLTDHGIAVWQADQEQLREMVEGRGGKLPLKKPEVDRNGWTKFQLWVLMRIFGGPKMDMVSPQVFKDNEIRTEPPT